jgi:L-seryl-tRNA(Ser) seleniumtransferase
MIGARTPELKDRAERLASAIDGQAYAVDVLQTESTTGGGALPGQNLPSWAVAVEPGSGASIDDLARRLRTGSPRVFATVNQGRVMVDLRTVLPEDDHLLSKAIFQAISER